MRSHGNQLVIFDDDPRIRFAREAKAFRDAAQFALTQAPTCHFTPQQRHDHYIAEAQRLEALIE